MFSRTCRDCRTTSKPATDARPDVGVSAVESMRSVVVLPAPFNPSRPKISPRRQSKSTSSTARVPSPPEWSG